jgi:hypothetical protein
MISIYLQVLVFQLILGQQQNILQRRLNLVMIKVDSTMGIVCLMVLVF